MSRLAHLYSSAIGKKAVMAVTGVLLLGFVLVHMLGNLKIYFGAETLQHYADWLRVVGAPLLMKGWALWIFRIGLIVAVALHILAAWQLTRQSHAARPVKYAKRDYVEAGYASRTMRWGGVLIAAFVVYHLLDLTLGTVNPNPQFSPEHVYANVVASFSLWPVSLFYVIANVLLGMHIYHGVWSGIRTLGFQRPLMDGLTRGVALALALVIAVGNISIPVAVLAGVLKVQP